MNLEKRRDIRERYKSLNEKAADQSILADRSKYRSILKEIRDLEPIIENLDELKKSERKIRESEIILKEEKDNELLELAREEMTVEKKNIVRLEKNLKNLFLPTDPRDQRNVIIEIRAGTGGEEAALFATDLYRMYTRYCEKKKLRIEVMTYHETGIKGLKEIIFLVSGRDAFGRLKYETGIHRVQRIPETESTGRVHTSAVTVAVMAEAEETEVDINERDLKIETFRAGGAGGQHVNTTDSAVRITHLPTNTVVICQDERSQQKNKTKAMRVLRTRISENVQKVQEAKRAAERKSQVGSGDRSGRIRTYNFPQNRVTDHRINKTLHKLDLFMEGDIEEIVSSLKTAQQEEQLLGSDIERVG